VPVFCVIVSSSYIYLKASTDDNELHLTPQATHTPKHSTGAKRLRLQLGGTINIPPGHPSARQVIDVVINPEMGFSGTRSNGFEWPIEQAFHSRESIRVCFPKEFANEFQKRGWGDRVTDAIVVPLSSEGDLAPLGVAILGLNTRRNFDADYSRWIDVLRAALSSYLTGAIAREEEIKRSE
jgi:hypothetical protein